jgi:hypothetical protein
VDLLRFQIGRLMAIVAIIALNLMALRQLAESRSRYSAFLEMCVVGALPMANILVIGGFMIMKQREPRSFLLGFEFFGAAALMFTVFLAWFFPDWIRSPFRMLLNPIFRSMGSPSSYASIFLAVVAVFLLLPQVFLGLIGGFLSRKFRLAERPA